MFFFWHSHKTFPGQVQILSDLGKRFTLGKHCYNNPTQMNSFGHFTAMNYIFLLSSILRIRSAAITGDKSLAYS